MGSSLADRIEQQIPKAESSYYQLVLVVGRSHTGKTPALQSVARRLGLPLVNVNLLLSEELVLVPSAHRSTRGADLLSEAVRSFNGGAVMLDNIELLFDPRLQLDPLRLLQSLARRDPVIASWAGDLDDEALIYAEAGHPEYRRYSRPEAIVVTTNMLAA